jgi:L-lysine exporter family protein LysE/ArgO
MHEIHVFIYAFILALGLILPLGPQNSFILSIGSHSKRYSQTLPVVIVASLCDTLLILLAVMGVSIAVMEMAWLKLTLTIVGSLFLFYFGWCSIRAKSDSDPKDIFVPSGVKKQLVLIATFSIFNPFAWLDTVMVIGSNAVTLNGADRYVFTATCIGVAWLWFFALAKMGHKMGQQLKNTPWRQRIIAIILWLSAILLLYRGLVS